MSTPNTVNLNNLDSRYSKPYPATSLLFKGFATRTTTATNVVFLGSSTTQGANATTNANRYVDILVTKMQSAFPSSLGSEASTVADTSITFASPSTAIGIHGYNGGANGTTSANYLTDAQAANVAALNPHAIFHMIGSNDYANNVDPLTYKSNVLGRITKLNSLLTKPAVHILINAYQRWDVTGTYSWSLYGAALKSLADTNMASVAYIDLNQYYVPLGVPSVDPYVLIDTDHIHQTNAGHAFMATLLARELMIPAASTVASASTGPAVVRLLSDSFTGSDTSTIIGRTADCLLGGTPRAWQGDTSAGGFGIVSGQLSTADATLHSAGFAIPANHDVQASFDLVSYVNGAAGALVLNLYAASLDLSTPPDRIGLFIDSTNNSMYYTKRISGNQTLQLSGSIAITPYLGTRITARYYKGSLYLQSNGTDILPPFALAWTRGGYVMWSKNGASTVTDNFALDILY